VRSIRKLLAVATAALVFSLAGCGAAHEVGSKNTDQRVTADPEGLATPNEDSLLDDGRKDVTIKSCKLGDPYGMGDRYVTADLKIRNSSSKVSDYLVEIEVTAIGNGKRLDTLSATATNVAPGQIVDTGKGTGEEDAEGMNDVTADSFQCSILSADRSASME
jgi:hypothetical protein